jgi:hypothetical protein
MKSIKDVATNCNLYPDGRPKNPSAHSQQRDHLQ